MIKQKWVQMVESWPWEDMLARGQLRNCLAPDDERDEIESRRCLREWPVAISALIGSMGSYASEWHESLAGDGYNSIRSGLVEDTYDYLVEQGYREELAQAYLLALMADFLMASQDQFEAHNIEFEGSQNIPLVRLSLAVARSVLGGLLGCMKESTVEWLLQFASACGSVEANVDLAILQAAMSGDSAARKAIVYKALPYWHDFINNGTLSKWDAYPEFLGFPYEYAKALEDDPDVLAVRAHLMYVNGNSGDEDVAVSLAAEAAVRGSATAWSLLDEWRSVGDESRVLRCLLSVGSLRLSGADCLTSKVEDDY